MIAYIKRQFLVSDYCEEPGKLVFELLEKYAHKKTEFKSKSKIITQSSIVLQRTSLGTQHPKSISI